MLYRTLFRFYLVLTSFIPPACVGAITCYLVWTFQPEKIWHNEVKLVFKCSNNNELVMGLILSTWMLLWNTILMVSLIFSIMKFDMTHQHSRNRQVKGFIQPNEYNVKSQQLLDATWKGTFFCMELTFDTFLWDIFLI